MGKLVEVYNWVTDMGKTFYDFNCKFIGCLCSCEPALMHKRVHAIQEIILRSDYLCWGNESFSERNVEVVLMSLISHRSVSTLALNIFSVAD